MNTPAVAHIRPAPAPTPVASSFKVPEIRSATKIAVWRTADGVYHESAESCRQSMMEAALVDFARVNGLTDATELAKALAYNIDRITQAVDISLKKIAA